jgi:glycosyltransferase involved in cell wall biosynthesis
MRNDFMALQFDQVDSVISPSRYLAGAYARAGVPNAKLRVIGYGVDVERFSRVRKARNRNLIRFSFMGYLGRHKGVHILLSALPLLRNKTNGRRFQVNIVGDGDLRETLEGKVRQMELGSAVKFLGKVPHSKIDEVLGETDVVVLPSIWPENQPVSIMEAMAARIPVIASRIGGIPELVQDGLTGYLFEPGNPEELAQRMAVFILYPEKIEILGENAKIAMAANTLERQVEEVVGVYNSL